MDNQNNKLKEFEGRKAFILTKRGFRYEANVLSVDNSNITFFDKYNRKILLPITELAQIMEISEDDN